MTMKSFKERFSGFAAAEPTEKRTIRGHEFRFYTLSAGMLFECRKAVPPILKALAVLFGDTAGDQTRHYQETTNPVSLPDAAVEDAPADLAPTAAKAAKRSAPVFLQKRIQSDTTAAALEIIKYRDDQKANAIGTLVESLQDPETKRLLGRVIIDSLRDDFSDMRGGGKKAEKDAAAIELVESEEFDVVMLKEMIVGVAAANKGLFGPLADQVTGAVKAATTRLLSKRAGETDASPVATDANKED